VIRADAEWDSASDKADWWNSGCGFIFREQDVDNHYLAYLGLDGRVYFTRFVRGRWSALGSRYYEKVGIPDGSADIELVVEGDKFTFFVNGEQVHTRQDTSLPSGNLAFTLLSGTNKGYGTKCKMSNIDLWVLD
jgi:hypothetical protein